MSDEPEAKDIHEAMLRVMQDVPFLKKQKSDGLKYTYVGEAATLEALHPAFVTHKLVMYPSSAKLVGSERYTTSGGTSMALARIAVRYTLRHVPSGTEVYIHVLGEAADSGDKCLSKAHTIAMKYALRHSFLIETGDDPDDTAHERAGAATAAVKAKREEKERQAANATLKIEQATTIEELQALSIRVAKVKWNDVRSKLVAMIERRTKELEKANV